MRQLILGAGYLGAKIGELALARGDDVVLADNWYATDASQLEPLARGGARIETLDIRNAAALEAVLALRPERVYLLAAQASRPLSETEPDYTEQTNVTGVRRVAQAVAAAGDGDLVFASSLHVYGAPRGEVGVEHPYGPQRDLAHLSKVYGELCLRMYADRGAFQLGILRLAILYGPSPVEHARPESQTVVDKFRNRAAAGLSLELDGGGRATIGVAHVEDAARIALDAPAGTYNVAAETVTVADVARLARGEEPLDVAACTFSTPFEYRHRLDDYLRPRVAA